MPWREINAILIIFQLLRQNINIIAKTNDIRISRTLWLKRRLHVHEWVVNRDTGRLGCSVEGHGEQAFEIGLCLSLCSEIVKELLE